MTIGTFSSQKYNIAWVVLFLQHLTPTAAFHLDFRFSRSWNPSSGTSEECCFLLAWKTNCFERCKTHAAKIKTMIAKITRPKSLQKKSQQLIGRGFLHPSSSSPFSWLKAFIFRDAGVLQVAFARELLLKSASHSLRYKIEQSQCQGLLEKLISSKLVKLSKAPRGTVVKLLFCR